MTRIIEFLKEHKGQFILFSVALITVIGLYIISFTHKNSSEKDSSGNDHSPSANNQVIDIPESSVTELDSSRVNSYQKYESDNSTISDIEQYWNLLEEDLEKVLIQKDDTSNVIDQITLQDEDLSSLLDSLSSPPSIDRKTSSRPSGTQTINHASREERHQRVMDQTFRRYDNDSLEDPAIDKDNDDNFFYQIGQGRSRSFMCRFSHKMRIKNGQSIPILLCEDFDEDGIFLRKGSFINGKCTLEDNRLMISIESINTPDQQYHVTYKAFDESGSPGLVCKRSRQEIEEKTSCLSPKSITSISLFPSEIGSLISSLINQDNNSVTIEPGYRFYIKKAS